MWGARDEDGNLWLGGVNTFGAQALAIVPELLESDDPRVQKRLLPVTFDEDDEEEQWRKHGLPELARLFLSRSQLMRRDLESMRKVRDTDYWILCIPKGHESAWLAGLNGVRVALYELHDMEPADMERRPDEVDCKEKELALWRIQFLTELQLLLMN